MRLYIYFVIFCLSAGYETASIVDTQNFVIDTYNTIAETYDYKVKKIETHDIKAFRKMKNWDRYKMLNITAFKLPFIAAKMHTLMKKQISDIPIYPGMRELVEQLKIKNYITCILSTNNLEVIKTFLKCNQFEIFDYIFTCKKISGKDKALIKIVRKLKLEKENVIYVGDEMRDIMACHKAGIKIISVCWGFNDKESLKKEHPQYIVESPEEIMQLFF